MKKSRDDGMKEQMGNCFTYICYDVTNNDGTFIKFNHFNIGRGYKRMGKISMLSTR